MRRIVIFLTLVLIFIAVFQLSRQATQWHYVLPAAPGELLYVAAFEDASTDWEQYQGQLSSEVRDGVIRLQVESDGEGLYSAAAPYFGDFDITVDSRVMGGVFDGSNNNGYGILFRQRDRANYYVFLVSSDGSYRVKQVVDNSSRFLSDWIFTDSINTEIGSGNTLRVVGYGDHFQFFINGEQMMLCIPDNPDAQSTMFNGACMEGRLQPTLIDDAIPYGRVGVAVEMDVGQVEDVIVEFDNVIVYGPDPIVE